jgi:transcriptional regulator with XRE-family HTH domain
MKGLNLIARQVSRLRYQRGWTQDELADLLQKTGWFISRSGVSKIEGGAVYVPDFRVVWLASVFKIPLSDLLPEIDSKTPVLDTLGKYIDPEKLTPSLKTLFSLDSEHLSLNPKILGGQGYGDLIKR